MSMANSLITMTNWEDRIASASQDRCELNILLKDEWRHKVVVRDLPRHQGERSEQWLAGDVAASPPAALEALHQLLLAYGQGTRTAVACLSAVPGRSGSIGLLPSVVDHASRADLSCAQAIANVAEELDRTDAYMDPAVLLGRGLFDAVFVILGADEPLPQEILFPLVVAVRGASCTLLYDTDLFEHKAIAGMLDIMQQVLAEMAREPAQRLADLKFVSDDQQAQLDAWNATDGEAPLALRLEALFEDAAARSPQHIAVEFDDVSLSYSALNENCNRVAHWLLSSRPDHGAGDIVALFADRSHLAVCTILGIWKAGLAFAPVDPSYPDERVLFTLRDTQAKLIIANAKYIDRLRSALASASSNVELVALESLAAAAEAGPTEWAANPALDKNSSHVAYVTYTSGTTGYPKGVPKAHRSVVNAITDLSDRYGMQPPAQERVALFSVPVFEPFLRQTLIALINSQTLVVVPEETALDPTRMQQFLVQRRITYLNGTRSVLQQLDLRDCTSLKRLLLVGEEMTASSLRQLRERYDGLIINEYAFTETAFVTAIKAFPAGVAERPNRSIGRPLRNVKCYVLDQRIKPVPIGAIGELYIGGAGVASGYLNREDLTAERFMDNPFQTAAERLAGMNARIYRTGDLARWLADGELEFMGRSDFQLKLNGVRVEPGEIEAQLLRVPGVRQCIVVPRERPAGSGNWHLIGYYVAEPGCEVTEAALLSHLEARLIRPMVPARLVRMDRFPVNINGKIDRKALPDAPLRIPADAAGEASTAPSELFEVLREFWAETLGLPSSSIAADDDFFRLGGHSVGCIQLLMRIWSRFKRRVTVEDFYRLKTLDALTGYLAAQGADVQLPAVAAGQSAATVSVNAVVLRANGLQQGLVYQALRRGAANGIYVMQSAYRYRCAVDGAAMKRAWGLAQAKYPSLRLRFEWRDEVLQVVEPAGVRLDWREVDLSQESDAASRQASIEDLMRRDRSESYRLSDAGLFRVYLIKEAADGYTLLFSCHHIIMDGWSLPLVHDTVHDLYLQLCRGTEPAPPATDQAYVLAQQHMDVHREDHRAYWSERIAQITEQGDFAGLLNARCRYRASLNGYDAVVEPQTRRLQLSPQLTAALKARAAASRVTLHSVLQFAWHRMLHAFGGGRTTVVGTIVSGRNLPVEGIEDSVGLLINTLPLIVDHGELATQNVAEALGRIQDAVNAMNSRSAVELGRLEGAGAKRSLFDTLLVFENYPETSRRIADECERSGLMFEARYDTDRVDYPIAVVAREVRGSLTVDITYAAELIDDAAMDGLVDGLEVLLQQVAANLEQPVRALERVSPATLRRFDDWNRTDSDFDADQTLSAVFEAVAERWPDEPAVAFRDLCLSYAELNGRANQLARWLQQRSGIKPGQFVALVMNKSERTIEAILAVWKAGAAYVPIDPSYPEDRIRFMMEDTGTRLVIADEDHVAKLQAMGIPGLEEVVSTCQLPREGLSQANFPCPAKATDLAYGIYTSGTTGRPKAVLVEHRGVVNLHASLERLFLLNRSHGREAILSFSNYVFDHFVEQMLDALLSGQKLVVLDDALRTDRKGLHRYMKEHGVTNLSGTPSVLTMYEYADLPALKRIDAIGEDFTFAAFGAVRSTFGGLVINGYGPTEISITSHKRLYPDGEMREDKSIGLPIANTKCYVLDDAMRRLPIGGLGELFIGGVGVARGYLHRPDLDADRFVANPFQSPEEAARGANARMYKTGDLARWLPNGELEYIGRRDLQVKIRGIRVELGEVESALASFPGVARAVIVAREHAPVAEGAGAGGGKYLVGFYLAERVLAHDELMRWLRTKLPEAIVPAHVLRIDELPVTASGKLDVGRLPPTDTAATTADEVVPPSTEIERALCRIWSLVLGTPAARIGAKAHFFGQGGDSLRAIRLAQMVTETFGQDFNVSCVFDRPTLEAQAEFLSEAGDAMHDDDLAIKPGAWNLVPDGPPVSYAQERLLFIDDFLGGTWAYNVPFVLDLSACDPTCAGRVEGALRALLARHAALRTLLCGRPDALRRQHVLAEGDALGRFKLSRHTATSKRELDRLLVAESEHVFDLADELPWRASIVELKAPARGLFLGLVFHHSCFDGWSWDVFRQELRDLLGGMHAADLSALPLTYADFSWWQRQRLEGQHLAGLQAFWTRELHGVEPLNLPTDHPRPVSFDHRGREFLFSIDAHTLDALKLLGRDHRVSLFAVLLGAFCMLLKRYSGRDDIVVGVPVSGRGRLDFNSIVGLFTNLLAMRVRLSDAQPLTAYLGSVGDVVLRAQKYSELPFEQVVKLTQPERDTSRHPLTQVAFNFFGAKEDALPNAAQLPDYTPDNDGRTSTKFDLSVRVTELSAGLEVNFTYAESLFEHATMTFMAAAFARLLQDLAAHARLPRAGATVADLLCVHDTERDGGTEIRAVDRPARQANLADRFEATVMAHADRPAIAFGDRVLSYRELDASATKVAKALLATGRVPTNSLVALMLSKSELLVAALLGVWKAGAGYVPIDPDWPDDRVAFVLDDAGIAVAIADAESRDRLLRLAPGEDRSILCVSELGSDAEAGPALPSARQGDQLAYAMYTSGTTGRPKGVLVRHASVASFCDAILPAYFGEATDQQQSVLLLANYVFDFSVEQLLLSLMGGHLLVIPEGSPLADENFYRQIERHELTYLSGTPSQVQQIDLSRVGSLRMVLVAGEAFQRHHFDKIRREYAGPILNAYGTTETTVYNTVKRFDAGDVYQNSLGEPLRNTRLFILDDALRPVAVGAEGELHIAGECVSAGYLNRAETTRERFVANPYQTPAERLEGRCAVLYRTGDVVRRRANGQIEFIGRNDSQVKINGVRIELGEIEAAMAAFPGIQECAAVVHSPTAGSPRLIGCYVDGGETDEGQLLAFLRTRLISSMVPVQLVRIDHQLPRSDTGKLDRNALAVAALPGAMPGTTAGGVVPRNRREARLCEIWAEALSRPAVAIGDDFFRCGGDSIGALQLASRIQREFGHQVSVKLIFECPTVAALAARLVVAPAAPKAPASAQPEGTDCPLLPIQRWFFAKPLAVPEHWNQYFVVRTPALDVQRLRTAFAALVKHHDAFGLRYRLETDHVDGVTQHSVVRADDADALPVLDVIPPDELQAGKWLEGMHRRFDLERGPLWAAAYVPGTDGGEAQVWIVMHHLVTDAVSWRIVARDLEILYHGGDLGRAACSYAQWARALQRYVPTQAEETLWDEAAQVLSQPDPAFVAAEAMWRHRAFTLTELDTRALLEDGGRAFEAQGLDLMLAAMARAMSVLSDRPTHCVTLEGHGRDAFEGAPNVQDTVGWFTTMYPLPLPAKTDLQAGIAAARAARTRVPHGGIGYGVVRGTYGSAQAPLSTVSFNYLGRFSGPSDVAAGAAGRWQLDAMLCGASKATEDGDAGSVAMDVTARCVGSRLTVEVDSRLGPEATEAFATAFEHALATTASFTSLSSAARRPGAQRAATPSRSVQEFEPFIRVGEASGGPVLFVFPPGEGGAESYLGNLARELSGLDLVLFNNIQLYQPMASYEALAEYYVAHLRRIQANGPYHLLGWSFGGVLSFEIARRLSLDGERIANLMMVDSYFDLRKAAYELDMAEQGRQLLDPINHDYDPDPQSIARLVSSVERTILFKATESDGAGHDDAQRRLFAHFARSGCNNLDSLLPLGAFSVVPLNGKSHFSWVRDKSTVLAMAAQVRTEVLRAASRRQELRPYVEPADEDNA